MSNKLVITRGIPGCGKSTWAAQWVAEDPEHRAEANRDHLRAMMHRGWGGHDTEQLVTVSQHAMIEQLLRRGVSVVCSDTNLPQRHARDLATIAMRAGAGFDVMDMTHVPLETCLERNARRTDKAPVLEAYIRAQHQKYVAPLKGERMPWPAEPVTSHLPDLYVPVLGTPRCLLVDIDGTTALKSARDIHDLSRVHEDSPNMPVVELVHMIYDANKDKPEDEQVHIVFMTGREGTDACRAVTKAWLDRHFEMPYTLYMRPAGDYRKDAVVKKELFDKHIRYLYTVFLSLDDRDQVVRMWREALGLTCLQVAYGAF
jgi:predicted kinase